MKILTLKRVVLKETGTFGVLIDEDNTPFCLTLELPWKDNLPQVSCIPKGEYVCQQIVSPKFGKTWEITNVLNREHILIHKGNFTDDTLGCIIVGEQFEDVVLAKADKIVTSVQSSGKAFSELNTRLYGHGQFRLVIKEA